MEKDGRLIAKPLDTTQKGLLEQKLGHVELFAALAAVRHVGLYQRPGQGTATAELMEIKLRAAAEAPRYRAGAHLATPQATFWRHLIHSANTER